MSNGRDVRRLGVVHVFPVNTSKEGVCLYVHSTKGSRHLLQQTVAMIGSTCGFGEQVIAMQMQPCNNLVSALSDYSTATYIAAHGKPLFSIHAFIQSGFPAELSHVIEPTQRNV